MNSTHDIVDSRSLRLFSKAFGTLMRMCGNLNSDPTEQFSKLIVVTKILLRRLCEACENFNTDIEEMSLYLRKI